MTLTEVFDRRVKETPKSTAYVFREQVITFEELGRTVEAMAWSLSQMGIKAGDHWALCVRNSPFFVTTWFALARLGAIAVHINFMTSEEEMAYIFKDSGARGLLVQKEFAFKGLSAAGKAGVEWVVFTDQKPEGDKQLLFSDLLGAHSGQAPMSAAKDDDTVAILYTSGTTGKSKGAMLTHRNLLSNTDDSITHIGITPDEVILCILPMFHIFSFTAIVLVGIRVGCKVIVVESITPPKPWLRLMANHKVSLFMAVPPVYNVLSKEANGIKGLALKYFFFRSVRRCISGAAPLPAHVMLTFEKKLGVPVLEGFGLTETSPVISLNPMAKRKAGTVGTVIPHVQVSILDSDGEPLSMGQEGEICVKGPNVMKGYHNLPQETAACFTPDGWFRTGDIGRIDEEGYITICDRIKDMIIIKGLKVFPAQVEEVILRHPDVLEAAVIGIPVEAGDEIIKAFVVPREGATLNKGEVQKLIQETLPPYKRPRDIEIRDKLPKNAAMKILKRELRREAIEKIKH